MENNSLSVEDLINSSLTTAECLDGSVITFL